MTVPFILQQAVWLYEKELDHVRDQMLRLNRNSHSIKQPDIGKVDLLASTFILLSNRWIF